MPGLQWIQTRDTAVCGFVPWMFDCGSQSLISWIAFLHIVCGKVYVFTVNDTNTSHQHRIYTVLFFCRAKIPKGMYPDERLAEIFKMVGWCRLWHSHLLVIRYVPQDDLFLDSFLLLVLLHTSQSDQYPPSYKLSADPFVVMSPTFKSEPEQQQKIIPRAHKRLTLTAANQLP